MRRSDASLSKEFVIEALMREPATYEKAALIPTSDHGGRPRIHQAWEYILFNYLVQHFQTAGKAQAELGEPRTWAFVRELARALLPPDMQPPERPMRWHHFRYVKYTYLERLDIVLDHQRVHRETSCQLAQEAGNFPGGGPAFTMHPDPSITTAADGKVVATRSKARPGARRKDPRTGKQVKRQVDPDKARYHEGGGAEAWGLKFLPVHTRTPYGRVVLDIPYVPGVSPADEANVAVETLRLLRPLLPGPHFHVHDGAMTAEHNQALLTELGTVLVNRPRAKRNPKVKGRSIGQREAHEGLVERKVIKRPDGTEEELLIHQRDGDLGLVELTETGDYHFTPLAATRLLMNPNRGRRSTAYRPYVSLRLPPEVALRTGRREVTVALYQTRDDKKRGYLRTAHVRAIGPASEGFWIYSKMRADSESLNRTIEDSLYRHHRAHSTGWARQQVDMLGLAGLINALTRERMRQQRLAQAA